MPVYNGCVCVTEYNCLCITAVCVCVTEYNCLCITAVCVLVLRSITACV